VLGPLSEIANRTGAVILCLRHLSKSGGGKAIYRGMGSIGYTAAARANFFVCEHPEEKGFFVIAASKFNLGPKPESIKYTLAFRTVEGIKDLVPYVANGEPCELTANDLAAADTETNGGEKFRHAVEFLKDTLKHGEVPEAEVKKEMRDNDISDSTLRRAKKHLKVVSFQKGRKWYMRLPTLFPPSEAERRAPKVKRKPKPPS
jgi:hypothetical protein